MRRINRKSIAEKLFLALGIFIYFSYFPLISFGSSESMNLEISLTQICLLLFVLAGLPDIWRARKELLSKKSVWITGGFVVWNILSLIWTTNLARGVLTVGLIGLLWLAFLWIQVKNNKKLVGNFLKVLVWGGVGVGVFVLWQMVGGALGVNSSFTALCNTCGADIFGFVKPNGFSIEPQFLGSLLLAPILVLAAQIILGKVSRKEWLVFGFLSFVLFLTMSRGAIYAFVIAGIVLCVVSWKKWRILLAEVGIVGLAFVFGLLMQGLMTQVNPRVSDNFVDGVTRSIHQMSMGVIDLRPTEEEMEAEGSSAILDGYVEQSTDERLSMADMSIMAVTDSPKNFLVGVGAGGTGVAFSELFGTKMAEIAQNQYLEVWVELGLAGLAVFGCILVGWLTKTSKCKIIWPILVAYGVQWMFFSGYPNAIHIYLVLGALLVMASSKKIEAMVKL